MGHLREQLTLLLVILVGGCRGRPLEIGTPDASTSDADTQSWPVRGQRNARSLRSEGPYLYWLANEPGQSAIRRCDKRDCGHTLTEVVRAVGNPGLMGFELWVTRSTSWQRTGSCPAPSATAGHQRPSCPTSNRWPSLTTTSACIGHNVRMPRPSPARSPVAKNRRRSSTQGPSFSSSWPSGSHLYGIAADAQYPGSPVSIVSAPKDGSVGFTVLAARQNHAATLTVSDGFVYWSTSDSLGTISRCPLAGCTSDEPQLIIEGQYYPHFVNPSGDAIFWMNGPSAPGSTASIDRQVQIIGCRIANCSSSRDVLEEGNRGWFRRTRSRHAEVVRSVRASRARDGRRCRSDLLVRRHRERGSIGPARCRDRRFPPPHGKAPRAVNRPRHA